MFHLLDACLEDTARETLTVSRKILPDDLHGLPKMSSHILFSTNVLNILVTTQRENIFSKKNTHRACTVK
jgi:hypothetical protein